MANDTAATGGRLTISLDTDRTSEEDYYLLRIPDSTGFVGIERADVNVKFHFQNRENVGLSVFNYDGFSLQPGVSEAYLEHPDGGPGSAITVVFSAGVDPQIGSNVPPGQDSLSDVAPDASTVTTQVDTLEGDYQYILSFGAETDGARLILEDGDGNETFRYALVGGGNIEFPVPVRVPSGGTVNFEANDIGGATYNILYAHY